MNINKMKIIFDQKFIIGWIILIATLFSFLFVTTSPFYAFNSWDDVAVYERVGHGWFSQGLIPYKELFDHKGPLHFFLFGIGTMLKVKSQYVGVFLIEIVLMSVTIWNYYRSALLFTKSRKISLLLVTLLQLVIFVTFDFYLRSVGNQMSVATFDKGGTPEEFCLPYISYIIYLMLSMFKNNKINLTNGQWVLFGLSISAIFLEKFTLSIPFILLSIGIIIYLFINDKKEMKKALLFASTSLFAILLIVLIYFKLNGAFSDFITYYFKVNIFNYSSDKQSTVLKLALAITVGVQMIISNPLFLLAFLGSVIGVTFTNKLNNSQKLIYLCLYSLTYLITMISGRTYVHYLVPILPYMVIGITFLWNDKWNNIIKKGYYTKLSLALICVSVITFGLSHVQVYYSRVGDRVVPTTMEKLANIIKKDPKFDKKKTNILPIYTGHVMLFDLTDTTPKTRFFYKPAMELKEYNKELLDNLRLKKPDYIYTRLGNDPTASKKNWRKMISSMATSPKIRKLLSKYLKNYKFVSLQVDDGDYDWTKEYLLKRK